MQHYTTGSAISFTPDHSGTYEVEFSCQGAENWREPIIGWAVVVVHEEEDENGALVHDTEIQPVVRDSDDGMAATIADYRANRNGFIVWRLIGRPQR